MTVLVGLGSATPADAATYRDNGIDVDYDSTGSYTVDNTAYTINDYSITSGQDSDGHIRPSDYRFFSGSHGSFTYSIGRKGSSEVANWWKARISVNQTTLQYSPDKLNFAFLGTLRVALHGGGLGETSRTFEVTNLGLAQGHSGASNNWWLGGTGCYHTDRDNGSEGFRITCTAREVGNPNVKFNMVLLRGQWLIPRSGGDDSAVNQIKVVSMTDPTADPGHENEIGNPPGMATLCSDWYSTGRCLKAGGSEPNMGASYVGNDKLSSFLVPAGKTLLLYSDASYGGRCQAFTQSVGYLLGTNVGNDTVSSYRLLDGVRIC